LDKERSGFGKAHIKPYVPGIGYIYYI